LKELYIQRKKLRLSLDKHAEGVKIKLDSPKNFSLELDSKAGGWVFRVTKKDESVVKDKKGYTIVSATKGGGTKFVDSTLSDLSSKYQQVTDEYNSKSEAVVQKVVEVAGT